MRAEASRCSEDEPYRQFAEECDRMAKQADTERQRNILTEMAKAWRRLAEDADRNGQR
jgi:hypothetical protein